MKFRAHETFFIRKGWLHKGIKHVSNDAYVFYDREKKATDILGIGVNMVKALRYWLTAVGLTEEAREGNSRPQYLTDNFGRIIYDRDFYFEEEGTLWFAHYKLATNKELATTWYWFFNEFNMKEFKKEDFISSLDSYIRINENESQVAVGSLEDDYNCLLNTYIPRNSLEKDNPESNIESPLSYLGLIEVVDVKNKVIRKLNLKKDAIHPIIILAAIVDQHPKENEIKISTLFKDPNNIGPVFNMDLNILNYYLDRLQELSYIRVIRTAGLDVIRLDSQLTSHELLVKYYDSLV